jgi:hypothetical protein
MVVENVFSLINTVLSRKTDATSGLGLVGITVLGYIPKEAGSPILLESQYKILFLIFVLFAALAPLVYNFSRHTEVKGDQIIANGKAFMFILASVFTI